VGEDDVCAAGLQAAGRGRGGVWRGFGDEFGAVAERELSGRVVLCLQFVGGSFTPIESSLQTHLLPIPTFEVPANSNITYSKAGEVRCSV